MSCISLIAIGVIFTSFVFVSFVLSRTEFAYPDEEGSDDDDDEEDESLEEGDRIANWVKDEVWLNNICAYAFAIQSP